MEGHMKKHLFLTGASGCGKTTIIRNALGEAAAYAGGLVTERALDAEGSITGYDLFPAAAVADFSLYEPKRFLDYSETPPRKDNEVFREYAVQLLKEAEYYQYAMIDEFGGFEILIPQFRYALADFLNLDIPIIGVIKGQKNAADVKRVFGLGDRFTEMTDMIRNIIAADSDCAVIEVKERGDAQAKRIVEQWVREYLG